MSKNNIVVGIDLGTTFSAIAFVNPETGRAEIIPSPEQERITASVMSFAEENNVVVGKLAKQNAAADPDKFVEFVKRQMGKPIEDARNEKGETILRGWNKVFGGKKYSAQELSAFVLKKLKTDAEARLGVTISDAVITCPAYFGDGQRAATKEAGTIAGFNVLGILDEPVAAALAYGLDKLTTDQKVFVFDLGGGTFDVVLLEIKGQAIREIAISGDHELGGKNWDDALIDYAAGQFAAKYGSDPRTNSASYQDLQQRVVAAKEILSRFQKATIICGHGGNSLPIEIAREQFEELTRSLVENCRVLCATVMREAKMEWKDVNTVLLVGGATRMPMIRQLVGQISGKTPSEELNPDECVAQGAAWQALLLAAKQGDLPREIERLLPPNLTVQKVTTHNMGEVAIRNTDGKERVFLMIPKSTPVPFEHTATFSTIHDNQTGVHMRAMECGDMDPDNTCDPLGQTEIGDATIVNMPPSPAGSPISITYKYNENGILEVSGTHVLSGRKATATFKRPGGLSDADMNSAMANMKKMTVSA